MMFIPVLLFCLGLVLLIKGGDWFVDGASGLAHRLHIPELLIGATVVSIGTTLPEVMVSATSAVSGHGEIAYGNAIGSVICNTSLIAAISLAASPCKVDKKALRTPVIFFFFAAIFYAAVAYFGGTFERWHGVALLCVFLLYMGMQVYQAKHPQADTLEPLPENEPETEENTPETPVTGGIFAKIKHFFKTDSLARELIMLAVGAALIAWGANLLVENGTKIAEALGVPESVIALTFVALGTSLPELVTAITSLVKGHGALSLGNVIGANLFNLVLVSGLSITLSPFDVPAAKTVGSLNASLVVDIPLMMFVMAFMTLPGLLRGKLSRAQGIVLLAIYAGFCVFQFV